MSMNKLGTSKYLPDLVTAKTSNKIPPSYHSPNSDEKNLKEFPGMLIIIGTIVGTALIIMNVLLIGCCLHRRSKKRLAEQGGQSSKSATIEMYAPSSYNDTVTGETLSSVSEKSETYSNEGSNADYVDEGRKQAASTYLMDQPEYPGSYSIYPGYEMQMQPNMAHKTHTLPHPHSHSHSHTLERNRSRDDQNLQYTGTMSVVYVPAKSSYISAPSPAPPADGSYYNMSDRYLSYPPPLDYQTHPPVPPHPHHVHVAPSPPPLPANGSLLRHQRGVVVPPDVLHNTSQNQQILQAQTLAQKREMSSFGNGYGVNEQEGHLV